MQKYSPRQQMIIMLVVILTLLCLYGYFRFIPQYQALNKLSTQLEKDKNHVEAPIFPDEPFDDAGALQAELEGIENNVSNLVSQLESYQDNLGPIDNQSVLLRISAVARTAGVRVIESVPYVVKRRAQLDTTLNKENTKKLTKKQKRLARKAAKRAARLAAKGGVSKHKPGELIDRLVNDLDEARPLQKMRVQGSFMHLQQFMQSVQALPWQVTIVKLDMDINAQAAPQGLPQPIMANMIIAM